MSSISGSESDLEEEEDSYSDGGGTSSNVTGTDNESSVEAGLITGRLSSKVVFQDSAGQFLSVYRCILQGKVGLSRYSTVQCVIYMLLILISNVLFLYYFSPTMSKMQDPP